MRPFLIGIAGGTASGKSLVCRRICDRISQIVGDTPTLRFDAGCDYITVIKQESFYKDVDSNAVHNFDHPDAFDFDLMFTTLKQISDGSRYSISEYNYAECRKQPPEEKCPAFIVLVEGILAFYEERIRSLFDMRIFVDCDADTRLASRVVRDVTERRRDLEAVLKQYLDFVKPAFEQFVLPTKKYADVIIPRGAENEVAISVIVQQTVDFLRHAPHENNAHATSTLTPGNFASFAAQETTEEIKPSGLNWTPKMQQPSSMRTPQLRVRIEPNVVQAVENATTPPSASSNSRLAPTLASPSVSPGKRARHTSESENANRRH